ncbi:MAG: S-layer homology domain-containing protein [Ruminococcaceae bacterium]|nr:S-layer homology domain-containing protein [Oscillospiraceae bacterium]
MKKFLSLVLVLVMAMSVVTISAGAASFSDSANIEYLEAAELLHGLNIHPGFEDGTYAPQNQMSRGFAAKCLVYCMLGADKAAKLPTGKTVFKDVTPDYRYAPFVNYLAEQGLISGYEDGTFKPGDLISAAGMLKMALGVLGYKKDYTGANWQWEVRTDAKAAGLMDGIADFRADSADREQEEWWALQRDECAQIMMNALTSAVVTYADGKATPVAGTKAAHYDITAGAAADEIMQLCEKSMPGLKKDAKATDFLDREGTGWFLNDEQVAFILE